MKKRKFFTIISVTFLLLASCTHDVNTEKNPENDTKENPEQSAVTDPTGEADQPEHDGKESNAPVITGKGIRFDFSGATGLAVLEDIDENSRAASGVNQLGKLVKIMSDGSFENAVIIEEGCELSDISAVYKPDTPESDNVYLVFDDYSKLENDGNGENKFGKLICVRSDGTFSDILRNDEVEDSEAISAYYNIDKDKISFDKNGNIYFLATISDKEDAMYSFSNYTQIIFQYNPKTDSLTQLVSTAPGTTYDQMQVDETGEWVFVSGNNSKAAFLRAIPVSNPDNPVNIKYRSYNAREIFNTVNQGGWLYDDTTQTLYYDSVYSVTKAGGFKDNKFLISYMGQNFKESLMGETYENCNVYWYKGYDKISANPKQSTPDEALETFFSELNWNCIEVPYFIAPENFANDVDLRFDKFLNDTGSFKLIAEMTYGKKNIEALKALDNPVGRNALFLVEKDKRYGLELINGDYYAYKESFLADILYVKGTDILLKDYEKPLYVYNVKIDDVSTTTVTVTGKALLPKNEDGCYQLAKGLYLQKDLTCRFMDKPENLNMDKPENLNNEKEYKYTYFTYLFDSRFYKKDGSLDSKALLEYLFSFCNVEGTKEFNLTKFKDDEKFGSLYTDKTNEEAIEWLSESPMRMSYLNCYINMEIEQPDSKVAKGYPGNQYTYLMRFISNTCVIAGSDTPAISWHCEEDVSVPYWANTFKKTKDGIFLESFGDGASALYNNYAHSYWIAQFTDETGKIVERLNYIKFPTGIVVESRRVGNKYLMQFSLTNEAGVEIGSHHIYVVDLITGETKDCFKYLPNPDNLEVYSFDLVGDLLYYSASRGTALENGTINIETNEYNPVTIQRKIVAVFRF